MARQRRALRVELHQLFGDLARLGRDAAALLLPGLGAELVEPDGVRSRRPCSGGRGQCDRRGRRRAAVVLEVQEVLRDAAHGELLEAAVAPDAVLVVDEASPSAISPRLPRPVAFEPAGLRAARAGRRSPPRRRAPGGRPAEEAAPQRTDQHGERGRPGVERRGRPPRPCPGARRSAKPSARRSAARRSACVRLGATMRTRCPRSSQREGDRAAACRCHSSLPLGDVRARLSQLRPQRGVRDEATRTRGGGVRRAPKTRDLHRAELEPPSRPQRQRRLLLAQHELVRRQGQAVLDVAGGGRLAQPARLAPRLLEHGLGILDDAERARRQVVEERNHLRVESRRQRLDAEEELALLDLLEEVARLRRRIDRGVGGGQNLGPRIGARRVDRLAHRVDVDRVERPQRPLRGRVVEANRFDLVAEQLDPHGVTVDGREDVDDRAAHRERPGVLDHGRARKACAHQRRDRRLAIEGRLRADRLAERVERRAGHHPPEARSRRGHQHARARTRARAGTAPPSAAARPAIGLHLGVGRRLGAGNSSTEGGASGLSPACGAGRKNPRS